jgi:hypothetical protein
MLGFETMTRRAPCRKVSRDRLLVLSCGALLLTGCGADERHAAGVVAPAASSDEAVPTEGTRPDVVASPSQLVSGVYRGTYFVPVPDELEDYALFAIDAIRIDIQGEDLELRYELPELLVGDSRGISFRGGARGDGTEYALDGDSGRATCSASNGAWTCDEVLHGIELEAEKMDRKLAELPASEALARRAVADHFAVDPIGILRFEGLP